ncbi:MAG: hypothetical protein ABJP48_13005 [Erythrobacter sp.]
MNQIQKYALTGGSCLIIGSLIGLSAANPNPTAAADSETAMTAEINAPIIDLGELNRVCNGGGSQACNDLTKACEDILSVGTANIDKLGPTYENANIDAFGDACEDERERAVDEVLERARENASSDSNASAPYTYRPDPAAANGMKQAAEINEMLCKTRGINCEEAKLFRRQYEEAISGF